MQKNSGYFGRFTQALIADLSALGANRSLRRVVWHGYLISCVIGIAITPLAVPFTALLILPLLLRWFFLRRLM